VRDAWGTKGQLIKGLGASGLKGPEPIYLSIYVRVSPVDTLDYATEIRLHIQPRIFTLQFLLSAVKPYAGVDEHLHNFLDMFAKFRKATISFVMTARLSLSPSVWNSAPTGWIFINFVNEFFENLSKKLKFYYNMTRTTSTAHYDKYTFFTVSCSILLTV
jgi:hypothetical protein